MTGIAQVPGSVAGSPGKGAAVGVQFLRVWCLGVMLGCLPEPSTR